MLVRDKGNKQLSYYGSREKVNGKQIYYNSRVIDGQIPEIFKRLTITEDTRQEIRNEMSRFFNAKLDGEGQLKTSKARLAKLEHMEKNLQRLYMEEEISISDFKEHRANIEAERARLKNMVESIRQRQHLVKADFEVALELATQFDFLYENGNFDQKRYSSGFTLNTETLQRQNTMRLLQS